MSRARHFLLVLAAVNLMVAALTSCGSDDDGGGRRSGRESYCDPTRSGFRIYEDANGSIVAVVADEEGCP